MPHEADNRDAMNTALFAWDNRASDLKASSVMKRDIVNPIPATQLAAYICKKFVPFGSSAQPVLTAP